MKIPPLNIFKLLIIVLCFTMLAGCSSNSSLTSSFSSRKYTKGYFADGVGTMPPVIASHKLNAGNDSKVTDNHIQNNKELITHKNNLAYIPAKAVKAKCILNSKPSIEVGIHANKIQGILGDSTKTLTVRKIDSDERTAGETMIIPGAIIFIFSLLFHIIGVSPWLMLAIGLALLIFGLLYYFDAANKGTPEPEVKEDDKDKPKQHKLGLQGFSVEVIGIAAMIIFALLFDSIAFGSAVFAISVSVIGIIGVLSILAAIAGFIMCIVSLVRHEKTNGFALAGLIIGLLMLAYLLFVH